MESVLQKMGWNQEALEQGLDVACLLDPELRILWTNSAWARFAADNGAADDFLARWGEGAPYPDGIAAPLDEWYRDRLTQCLESQDIWEHEYECSSPDNLRVFRLLAYPLAREALLVVHSIVVDRPHGDGRALPSDFVEAHYLDDDGIVHQCMHCRRTHHQGDRDRWDWVPQWVAQSPPSTSHGLCPPCFDFYYPAPTDEDFEE